MKKLRRVTIPQPPNASRRMPRTRFEVAAQLLRLEFERARLLNEIETARQRGAAFSRRLIRTSETIRNNLNRLMEGNEP